MRPVKKALKALDQPDVSLSDQDQLQHTRDCLLQIGKQIDVCLNPYAETEKKEWRSNLWYFVSKFTELDAKRLFKIYKHALKQKAGGDGEAKGKDKGSSGSPAKSKPNGVTTEEKEKERDRSGGKKKKKDKDKERSGQARYPETGIPTSGRYADPPLKRKRDENDADASSGLAGAPGGGIGDNLKSMSFKRLNMDRHEDRKKHHRGPDYYGGSGPPMGSGSYEGGSNSRRQGPTSPSTPVLAGAAMIHRPRHPATRRKWSDGNPAIGNDRNGLCSCKWISNMLYFCRYSQDYKRDRYDGYGRSGGGQGSYHRERDRRPEKRR